MIGGIELHGHAGGGRLVIEPVVSTDRASAVWLWPRVRSTTRGRGGCVWLTPAQLRALAAAATERADYLDPALCWTGCKDTGRGAALSVLGFHSVTRPRSYHFRKVKA